MIQLIEDKIILNDLDQLFLIGWNFKDNVFSSQLISKITFLLAPHDRSIAEPFRPLDLHKDAERHLIVRP